MSLSFAEHFTEGALGKLSSLFSAKERRIRQAAEQFWQALLTGAAFEVGSLFSMESDTTQAVLQLRKMHPTEVQLTLQKGSWVLSKGKTSAVTEEGWKWLERGGYLPDNRLEGAAFLDAHARWMHQQDTSRGNGKDPVEEAQRKALAQELEKHRIVMP